MAPGRSESGSATTSTDPLDSAASPASDTGGTFSRTPLSRRGLLKAGMAGAAGLAAAPLLSACGGSGSGSGGGGGKATVRMWTWYTYQRDQWPQLIDEFQQSHPNITIENRVFGDSKSFLPALQSAVSGGNPPEIFAPHVLALQYGNAGIAADLRKELGSDFTKDFFQSTIDEYTDNGKQYALGWIAQTFGIFYNPKLLSQAGVEPPETWDDLLTVSQAVKKKTGKLPCILCNNPGTSGIDLFWPIITQVTNDPTYVLSLDRLANGVKWTDAPVIQALEVVQKLVQGGAFQDGINATAYAQGEQIFYSEQSAMMFAGSFVPVTIQQNAPDAFKTAYTVAQTPALKAGGKRWCANQAGAGLAVSNVSKNKDAALEFIKFLYQPDRYAKTMNDSFSMPSTKSAAAQVKDPIIKEMTSWLLAGNGAPHIPFGKGSSATADALTALIGGQMNPQQAAAAMQAAVEQARK